MLPRIQHLNNTTLSCMTKHVLTKREDINMNCNSFKMDDDRIYPTNIMLACQSNLVIFICLIEVDNPSSITFLVKTHIFEGYVVWCGSKKKC